MKQLLTFCLTGIVALFLFFGIAANQSEKELIAAADALDKQFFDAYNNKDVDALMATYWNSPEMVSYPPDAMVVKGWAANKEAMTQGFAAMPPLKLELLESTNRVEGSVVIGHGKWRMTVTPPEGEPAVMEGRYTDIKANRDGKLLYILDHASVPLPPPPGE